MSGLAGLYAIPQTPEAWERWNFVHIAHHRDVVRGIFQSTGISLPVYALDPPGDVQSWLAANQAMHIAMDVVLGIQSFNLEGLDPRDEVALATWIRQHGLEHFQAATKLGIG